MGEGIEVEKDMKATSLSRVSRNTSRGCRSHLHVSVCSFLHSVQPSLWQTPSVASHPAFWPLCACSVLCSSESASPIFPRVNCRLPSMASMVTDLICPLVPCSSSPAAPCLCLLKLQPCCTLKDTPEIPLCFISRRSCVLFPAF